VTARGLASVQVVGRNWIVALGRGLEELGRADDLMRLACEVLPNGTVIARDITSGIGYIVQAIGQLDHQETPVSEGSRTPAPHSDLDDPSGQSPMQLPDADLVAEPGSEDAPVDVVGDLPMDDELTAEDSEVEPIFELPADAIRELVPEEDPGWPILQAETVLQACERALGAAKAACGAESGAVILAERGYLRFVAATGPHATRLLGTRLPLGTGVAGFAIERKRTIVLADAHTDPRHCAEVDALTGYVTREIAVVPLVLDGLALGVLELMNLPEGRRFTKAEMDALMPLADALAMRVAR
jgi:GAF domain-containing protein